MTYNLYTVTYSFETPGERAKNRARQTYTVVSRTAKEAQEKAYQEFVLTPTYSDLGLHWECLKVSVRQTVKKKINVPTLSLTEDIEQFEIGVQVSEDEKSLEFLVREK